MKQELMNDFGETSAEFSAHFRFHDKVSCLAVGRWSHCDECESDFVTAYGHDHLSWWAKPKILAIQAAYHKITDKLWTAETYARLNAESIYYQIVHETSERLDREAQNAGQSEWSDAQRAEMRQIEHQAWLYSTVAQSITRAAYIRAVMAEKRFFGWDGQAAAGNRVRGI
jgi:hypothetical protein